MNKKERLKEIRERIEEIYKVLQPLNREKEKLKHERSLLCNCDVLQKTLATNWTYYTCVDCGAEYFSSGNAKVLDFSEEDKKRLEKNE